MKHILSVRKFYSLAGENRNCNLPCIKVQTLGIYFNFCCSSIHFLIFKQNGEMTIHVPQAVLVLVFHYSESVVDTINDDK